MGSSKLTAAAIGLALLISSRVTGGCTPPHYQWSSIALSAEAVAVCQPQSFAEPGEPFEVRCVRGAPGASFEAPVVGLGTFDYPPRLAFLSTELALVPGNPLGLEQLRLADGARENAFDGETSWNGAVARGTGTPATVIYVQPEHVLVIERVGDAWSSTQVRLSLPVNTVARAVRTPGGKIAMVQNLDIGRLHFTIQDPSGVWETQSHPGIVAVAELATIGETVFLVTLSFHDGPCGSSASEVVVHRLDGLTPVPLAVIPVEDRTQLRAASSSTAIHILTTREAGPRFVAEVFDVTESGEVSSGPALTVDAADLDLAVSADGQLRAVVGSASGPGSCGSEGFAATSLSIQRGPDAPWTTTEICW